MAEKKTTTKATDATVKPIVLRDQISGDVYVLEFNRDSVKFAESRKFNIDDLTSTVNLSAIEELFFCSFRMHQPNKSKADTDKILYDRLGGMPEGMLERLVNLYLIPFTTLVQDEDKAKNATMTVEF